jgi:hypothetical protein
VGHSLHRPRSPRTAARATRAATLPFGLGNPRGWRTSCTAQVLLGSAVAALALPTAVRSAEALPVVESESASPGLGLAASWAMSRTGSMRTAVGSMRKNTVVLRVAYPDRKSESAARQGR